MLEQTLEMYQTGISRQQQPKTYFVVGNLEYLSASALYRVGSGPLKFNDIPMFGHTPSVPSGPLTIRDFPASGFQLHIHERPGGKALFKSYSGKKIAEINSYDAAMADSSADKLDIPKLLKWLKEREQK